VAFDRVWRRRPGLCGRETRQRHEAEQASGGSHRKRQERFLMSFCLVASRATALAGFRDPHQSRTPRMLHCRRLRRYRVGETCRIADPVDQGNHAAICTTLEPGKIRQ